MIDVYKYIIQLLERNNELTIPGLGGFNISRTETKYHSDNGTLYPSTVSVTFNPFRHTDDGVLRDQIASAEQISNYMAEYEVQKFVIRAKQGLSRNQRFELPGIGVLESDEMANIRFSTTDDFVLNKANFGLNQVVSRASEPHKSAMAAEKKIVFVEPARSEKSVWKWLLLSLAIIIIVSAAVLLGVRYYLQTIE